MGVEAPGVVMRRRRPVLSCRDMNEMGALTTKRKTKVMTYDGGLMIYTEKRALLTSDPIMSADPGTTLEATQSIPPTRARINCEPSWFSIRRAWGIHFLVALTVLAVGIANNRGPRKFLPINPTLSGTECASAYLNVMAPSKSEADAVVCCSNTTSDQRILDLGICSSKSEKLPLASRLGKFPEAWLLPLFPLFVRILYWLYRIVTFPLTEQTSSSVGISQSLRRLCLYTLLLSFRGWVLYVYLNRLEDELVSSDASHATTEGTKCWYDDGWLQVEQETCVGRSFDFSDHIVLFYAQILPIALIETIHAFERPYWWLSRESGPMRISSVLVPIVLVTSHLYLQLITAISAYKTAAYFHTPGEVIVGFIVSLLITVPLVILQCSANKLVATWRAFFFNVAPSPGTMHVSPCTSVVRNPTSAVG